MSSCAIPSVDTHLAIFLMQKSGQVSSVYGQKVEILGMQMQVLLEQLTDVPFGALKGFFIYHA